MLSTLNPDASQTFGAELPVDPVRSAIAAALRDRGHIVHEHVGGASFRCDLAVANADGDGYDLGILLDRDEKQGYSVEERFVFRPGILRSFGWRIIDMPVASWHRASAAMIDRIETELARSSWDMADSDPYVGVALPEASQATAPSPAYQPHAPDSLPGPIMLGQEPSGTPPQPAGSPQATPGMTEFRFVEGTSNKFWRVGVNGCDLIVEFGRIGTNGQKVVKSFEDEERAKREAVKLTLEKTRKGYQEV